MGNKRKGVITPSPEWAKHYRKFWKRLFWSKERGNQRTDINNQLKDQ